MSTPVNLPRIDLRAFNECTWDYDAEVDVALVYFTPQCDQRLQVDHGWFLRLAGRDVTGVEIHGVRRMAYTDRFLAELLRATMTELDRGPNRDPLGVLADSIARTGDWQSRPQLMRLGYTLIGIAAGKLSAARE
jgi:hypothetical protein